MGTVNNPHNYSTTSGTTPTAQITDDVDYPHTGLIKSLSQGIRGNYAIKGSATDFDITFADGGDFTTIAVTTGKAYRDGKLETITALTATNMNTSYNSGTGAVDITPVTDDFYLMLVAKSDNTMVLRGSNAVTNRIPDYEPDDIPIAIIKVVGGSADDSAATSDRLVQFLTTDKVSNDLSIGYDNSGYTEALSVSTNAGDTTIENKVQDKDIIFKINDGGVSREILRLDADDNEVRIVSTIDGAGMGPQLTLFRDTADASDDDLIGLISFKGEDSTNTETEYIRMVGQILDETNGSEDAQFFIRMMKAGTLVYPLKMTPTQTIFNAANEDIDVRIDGATDNLFYADSSADKIGIGLDDPAGKLHVKTTDTSYAALFETTDDSASAAPDVALYRNSATPANGDDLGHLIWRGTTDDGDSTITRGNIADIFAELQVASTGSESGKMHLRTKKAGSMNKRISIEATKTIVNQDNVDADFIVEGVGNANLIFADSSADKVGIGHAASTIDATLDILTGGTFRNTRLLTVSVSASTTLTEAAHAGRYNICAGNITLPSTSTAGEHYAILNTTGGNITIGRNGNNINGAGSDFTLGTFKAATCIAIGSNNWMVVG